MESVGSDGSLELLRPVGTERGEEGKRREGRGGGPAKASEVVWMSGWGGGSGANGRRMGEVEEWSPTRLLLRWEAPGLGVDSVADRAPRRGIGEAGEYEGPEYERWPYKYAVGVRESGGTRGSTRATSEEATKENPSTQNRKMRPENPSHPGPTHSIQRRGWTRRYPGLFNVSGPVAPAVDQARGPWEGLFGARGWPIWHRRWTAVESEGTFEYWIFYLRSHPWS